MIPFSAAQNDDYAEPVGLLKTPAGSIRGAKYCIEVGVIEDYLKEGRESFSVEATLLSPPSARIGSNGAQSSTASVEVIIIDNDGKPYLFWCGIYLSTRQGSIQSLYRVVSTVWTHLETKQLLLPQFHLRKQDTSLIVILHMYGSPDDY